MGRIITTVLNPVALNKFHDLRSAEKQERYDHQLFTYDLWQVKFYVCAFLHYYVLISF